MNWNLREDTLACVASLVTAGLAAGHVIVVDNASQDGSVRALQERFGKAVLVIENDRNLGFAGGNNLGIRYALEHGAEWILLLNNDTTVAPSFLREFKSALDSDARYAILGPLILYHHSPNRIWYLGDRLIPGLLATHSLYRGFVDKSTWPLLLPIDFITGCGMLIKREVFNAVGLFEERDFMYGEDVDFCWRARQAGFRLAAVPRAKMWHKVSASANRDEPASRYLRVRNQIRFYQAHARGLQVPLMIGFTGIRALRTGLGDLLQGRPALLRPLAAGWLHGWLNRPDSREYSRGWNT